ncbi:MAG: hypothetical protein QXI81_06145 [Nitrososphaerota archaeon]
MEKRVKIIKLDEKALSDVGMTMTEIFYMLSLSPESHAAGGITRHANGEVEICLAETDIDKLESIKQILGEPKVVEEKRVTSKPPPPSPTAELELAEVIASGEVECPFCHAKLRLKPKASQKADVQDGSA